MLTDIEKVIIKCFCPAIPTDQLNKFAFMELVEISNAAPELRKVLYSLRDEMTDALELKRDTIKALTEQRDHAREDHAELKRSAEALIYKIKEPDRFHAVSLPGGHAMTTAAVIKPVQETYEFKELKNLLGIF